MIKAQQNLQSTGPIGDLRVLSLCLGNRYLTSCAVLKVIFYYLVDARKPNLFSDFLFNLYYSMVRGVCHLDNFTLQNCIGIMILLA